MDWSAPFIIAISTLLLCLLMRPFAIKLKFPYLLLLIVIGFIVSETLVEMGFDNRKKV